MAVYLSVVWLLSWSSSWFVLQQEAKFYMTNKLQRSTSGYCTKEVHDSNIQIQALVSPWR
jgi:hypothetical protein